MISPIKCAGCKEEYYPGMSSQIYCAKCSGKQTYKMVTKDEIKNKLEELKKAWKEDKLGNYRPVIERQARALRRALEILEKEEPLIDYAKKLF